MKKKKSFVGYADSLEEVVNLVKELVFCNLSRGKLNKEDPKIRITIEEI
jgi:hypothetical protein